MLIPKHTLRFLYVEPFRVRVKRYNVVPFAYFVVCPPPDRRQHFRVLRQTPVVPREGIADLEAGVLDAREQSVMRPVARKGQQVATGFQDALTLARPLLAPFLIFLRLKVVPIPPHEREAIRRVGNDGVNAVVVKVRQCVKRVTRVDHVTFTHTVAHSSAVVCLSDVAASKTGFPNFG